MEFYFRKLNNDILFFFRMNIIKIRKIMILGKKNVIIF